MVYRDSFSNLPHRLRSGRPCDTSKANHNLLHVTGDTRSQRGVVLARHLHVTGGLDALPVLHLRHRGGRGSPVAEGQAQAGRAGRALGFDPIQATAPSVVQELQGDQSDAKVDAFQVHGVQPAKASRGEDDWMLGIQLGLLLDHSKIRCKPMSSHKFKNNW